jgi:hypothetical protein
MSVWDATKGKRVGQVGRVECDDMGVRVQDRRRRDVHPLFDETALERVRIQWQRQRQTPRRAFASAGVPLERCRIRPV